MGKGLATGTVLEYEDEREAYVMIDARALILDIPDEVKTTSTLTSTRPPMRGVQASFSARDASEQASWRGMLGAPRRLAIAEASTSVSMWQRLGRKLQSVWQG
jgi:hypothetical protein